MSTKIFVNLLVKDLNKSMDFFKALGWTFTPQFTDDTAACLVMSNEIYAMLLTHKKVWRVHQQEDSGWRDCRRAHRHRGRQ